MWGWRAPRGKVTGLVFKSGFTSLNTGWHEASAAGECGYCSLKLLETVIMNYNERFQSYVGLFS